MSIFLKILKKIPDGLDRGLGWLDNFSLILFIHHFQICIPFKIGIRDRNCGNQILESTYTSICLAKPSQHPFGE